MGGSAPGGSAGAAAGRRRSRTRTVISPACGLAAVRPDPHGPDPRHRDHRLPRRRQDHPAQPHPLQPAGGAHRRAGQRVRCDRHHHELVVATKDSRGLPSGCCCWPWSRPRTTRSSWRVFDGPGFGDTDRPALVFDAALLCSSLEAVFTDLEARPHGPLTVVAAGAFRLAAAARVAGSRPADTRSPAAAAAAGSRPLVSVAGGWSRPTVCTVRSRSCCRRRPRPAPPG